MTQEPLDQKNYKPRFSGHQKFALRYGWLKKAYDAVTTAESSDDNKNVFLSENAIARFGVGKNMVDSIRHWATAAGIIETNDSEVKATELGDLLFGDNGLDPYMEHSATLWLIHWHLAKIKTEKLTWFWAFSHCQLANFEHEHIIKGINRFASEKQWPKIAATTLKNDVACFVNTYSAQRVGGQKEGHDDAIESPLIELGLIKSTRRDSFRFVRGAKPTLGDGVFAYALFDFWDNTSSATTLSFEAIAHEPGSPGRVFLLDENSLASYLFRLEDITKGELRWSETSGLKQIIREPSKTIDSSLSYIAGDFNFSNKKRVA